MSRRLSEEGYCVFPDVLEAKGAKKLEDICRERIEAISSQSGHATGGGEHYISLEDALKYYLNSLLYAYTHWLWKLRKPSLDKILFWLLLKYDGPSLGKRGSLFIYHNGLWHAIGANTTTNKDRFFANAFYIPGAVHRSPDIWPLVTRNIYDTFPPRLQELIVRSVENAN